jgi:hypothetical protein
LDRFSNRFKCEDMENSPHTIKAKDSRKNDALKVVKGSIIVRFSLERDRGSGVSQSINNLAYD